jgi:hypothetical protein
MNATTIIGGLFVFAGLATIAVTGGRQWLRSRADTQNAQSSSVNNTAAPAAYREHVATIIDASEGAPPDIRLAYLADGLSEADVLRREIARLRESQA